MWKNVSKMSGGGGGGLNGLNNGIRVSSDHKKASVMEIRYRTIYEKNIVRKQRMMARLKSDIKK